LSSATKSFGIALSKCVAVAHHVRLLPLQAV
jgi:hypothetical protein